MEPTSKKKDFLPVVATGGQAWEQLQAQPQWEELTVQMDENATGYPEFGDDLRKLFTQYEPESVTSAVQATHQSREPLVNPQTKTVRWLLALEAEEEKQHTVNDLAARLALNVDIPVGPGDTGDLRSLTRRKQIFLMFRQMLVDLRKNDIQLAAFNGDPTSQLSPGFIETATRLNAATNYPQDVSGTMDTAPISGNEDEINPYSEAQQLASHYLTDVNRPLPPVQKFMKKKFQPTEQTKDEQEAAVAAQTESQYSPASLNEQSRRQQQEAVLQNLFDTLQ